MPAATMAPAALERKVRYLVAMLRSLALVLLLLPLGCRTVRTDRVEQPGAPETLRTLAQGRALGGHDASGAEAWLGLPFAQPPVGALRWRAPQPPSAWSGVRDAVEYGPPCSQPGNDLAGDGSHGGAPTGSEDCLTLNVFAPPFTPEAIPQGAQRLPVIVSSTAAAKARPARRTYRPGLLALEQHAIVISVQYRLGPLGWLRHRALRAESSDPLEQSGNFGTLDLIRALHWVQENAAAFGGDAGNVTIFGESAGATNVLSLLLAPAAHGLFQRAIVESAAPWLASNEQAESWVDDTPAGHRGSSNELLARLYLKSASRAIAREARPTDPGHLRRRAGEVPAQQERGRAAAGLSRR